MAGKVTENAKKYIRELVLAGETYADVASKLETHYDISISKQAVSYYVGKMNLRDKAAQVREQQRQEQEQQWREALMTWVQTVPDNEVTLRAASDQVGAPIDWTRDVLIEIGAYDDTTFRERIDVGDLMTQYVVDDLSLSELHERYYADVCISTLTQTVRKLMYEYGVEPRPKSCANNEELRSSWRQETLAKLEASGWQLEQVD